MDRNPSVTLDNIRTGGQKMLATARTRLAEVEEALNEGRFVLAKNHCYDLYGKLNTLADAETSLGVLATTSIVRAEDVEVGMLIGAGPVTDVDVDRHQCHGGGDHEHVIVTLEWEDGTKEQYAGHQEMVVGTPGDE